jgi:GTPase SAR1 family protein
MVIVEGPDGAGKTTLVAQIVKKYPKFKMSPYEKRDQAWFDKSRQRTYKALADCVYGLHTKLYDRLFYSELIYGEITRGRTLFSPYEKDFVERCLRTFGSPMILCMPPLEVVKMNVGRTEQHDFVAENIDKIYRAYANLIYAPGCILYDYTTTPFEYVTSEIDLYLKLKEKRQWS